MFHYRRTRREDKILHYLREAGSLSRRRSSFKDALGFFLDATKIIEADLSSSAEDREWIHTHLGETYSAIGLYDESLSHFRLAVDLARDNDKKADILRMLAHALIAEGNYDMAIEELVRSLGLLGDSFRPASWPSNSRR